VEQARSRPGPRFPVRTASVGRPRVSRPGGFLPRRRDRRSIGTVSRDCPIHGSIHWSIGVVNRVNGFATADTMRPSLSYARTTLFGQRVEHGAGAVLARLRGNFPNRRDFCVRRGLLGPAAFPAVGSGARTPVWCTGRAVHREPGFPGGDRDKPRLRHRVRAALPVGLRPCDLVPLPGRSLTPAVPDRTASVSERPVAKERFLAVKAPGPRVVAADDEPGARTRPASRRSGAAGPVPARAERYYETHFLARATH